MRWIRAALSLIIVLAMVLNNMVPAKAAAPLVVPAGAYAATFAYAAGAVAVGAIGTAVGYEYGDEIRQVGIDAWNATTDEIKNTWRSAVDKAIYLNKLAVNGANALMDGISSFFGGLYGTAYNLKSYGETNPTSGLSSNGLDLIYATGSYNIVVNGFVGRSLNFRSNVDPKIVELRDINSQLVATFDYPTVTGLWNKFYALGAKSIKVPSDYSVPNLTTSINKIVTTTGDITLPPITAIQPVVKTTGDQLVYDYYTGTVTYANTGQPYLGNLDNDVIWQIPTIMSTVVAGQREVGFKLGDDFISTKTNVAIKPYDLPQSVTDFTVRYRPANDVIDLSLDNRLTYPLDIVVSPAGASINDIDVVINPTGVADFDIANGLITAVGVGSATLTVKHKYDVISKQIDLTINVADVALPYDQIMSDTLTRVDTNTGSIVDILSNPVGDVNDIQWDKLKTTASIFTTKFPFSLPWDVYNAFVAVFGDVADADPPEWVWEYRGNTMVISIPQVLVDMSQYFRAAILILFDIGMIYAVRKLLGGAS